MLFKSILLRKVINSLRYVKINMPFIILYKTLNLIYPSSHKQKTPLVWGKMLNLFVIQFWGVRVNHTLFYFRFHANILQKSFHRS